MYTMDLRREKPRGAKGLLLVAGIVAAVAGISLLGSFFSVNTPYAGYAAFALLVLLAFLVMRRFVDEYRYRIHEGVFTVERLAGERGRALFQADLADAAYYGPEQDAPEAENARRFTLPNHAGRERMLICGGKAVVIQPDEELDRLLREAVPSE